MGYSWLFDRENDDEQMDGIGFCHLQTQPFEGFMNCGFWFWFWAVDDLFAAITYIYIKASENWLISFKEVLAMTSQKIK